MTWMWPRFIKALKELEIGGANREGLDNHLGGLDMMDNHDDLYDSLQHFMIRDCYDHDKMKITIVSNDDNLCLSVVGHHAALFSE